MSGGSNELYLLASGIGLVVSLVLVVLATYFWRDGDRAFAVVLMVPFLVVVSGFAFDFACFDSPWTDYFHDTFDMCRGAWDARANMTATRR